MRDMPIGRRGRLTMEVPDRRSDRTATGVYIRRRSPERRGNRT